MSRNVSSALLAAPIVIGSLLGTIGPAQADLAFIDLTLPIPAFAPSTEDPTKPDLSKPIGGSAAIAGFYHQAVLYPADLWPTNEGHFASAALLVQEHNGTSFNSPNHHINNARSLEPGGLPQDQRKASEELSLDQLTGKIVLVDVSDRVAEELARNGGLAANGGRRTRPGDSPTTMSRNSSGLTDTTKKGNHHGHQG